MTNHPNRGQRGPLANPLPAEIIATRKAAGLTQTEAASLVCGSLRAWQQWEAGDRRMHPAFWDLFCIKISINQPLSCRATKPIDGDDA